MVAIVPIIIKDEVTVQRIDASFNEPGDSCRQPANPFERFRSRMVRSSPLPAICCDRTLRRRCVPKLALAGGGKSPRSLRALSDFTRPL
jgi:hypothetical protein